METIKINDEYEIFFDDNLIDKIKDFVDNHHKSSRILIIKDKNIDRIYKDITFTDEKQVFDFVVEVGEKSKSISTYDKIISFMSENKFDRSDLIIVFGGGVVGDLGGFVASTYMRSIDYIQIPTSLLSMVDSSVGSKTAINTESGKNLIGTFYNPKKVYINFDFLSTLPNKELKNGLAEIIKYAFIYDRNLYKLLNDKEAFDVENLKVLIHRCVEIKKIIVNQDMKENGIRKILNFGHTVGHAIEKITNYEISHGYAVAMGMICICKIFINDNEQAVNVYDSLLSLLDKYSLPTSMDFDLEEMHEYIFKDKKSYGEFIDIIKLDDIGKAKIVKINKKEFIYMMNM
ncbi:3-dehydroquinate synthase [Peptostreptococcus equinus]|uniref:3-dehydroquinate synthase n=1 Tax=Peptostreptococcus equinus TaxID=3003601 RepID=A0ABY7JTV3_9FIRM|nr:3-dehydroquinate synthase [Peptostreptococcus sp. CBA3647]WAW15405.1 3-dehydroquinate synthase [Peptostreptococcus sp. CBA3647]